MPRPHLIITVHGIRTFGHWQERLEALVKSAPNAADIDVYNYKYGYFSVLAFLIPPLRWLVVRRFRNELRNLTARGSYDRIDLVGHSFGTHILAWAIWGLAKDENIFIHTIILSGSVLRSGFLWSRLIGTRVGRVINDCGTKDTALLLSQFFVLFTGMAGRFGLSGMTSDMLRNRYSPFGHSGYFKDSGGKHSDEYMQSNWLCLLLKEEPISKLGDPPEGGAWNGLVVWMANNAEPVKLSAYLSIPIALTLWVWAQRQEAVRQRDEALLVQSRYLADIARQKNDENDHGTALALALEALPDSTASILRPYVAEAEQQLYHALWNLKEDQIFARHSGPVTRVSISPNGKRALSASTDGTAVLWDLEHSREAARLVGHVQGITAIQFSPDSALVATGSNDGGLRLWNAASGSLLRVLPKHENMVTDIVFSSDGQRIGSSSWDMRPRATNLQGEEQVLFLGHTARVNSIDISSDGKTILTASYDGSMRLMESKDGSVVREILVFGRRVSDVSGGILLARFVANGSRIFAITWGGTASLWEASTGSKIKEYPGVPVGCTSCVDVSQDRKFLLITLSGSIQILSAQTGELVRTLPRDPKMSGLTSRFNRDASVITSATSSGGARIYSIGPAQVQSAEPKKISGHEGLVRDAVAADDGEIVVTGGNDGTSRVWKPVAGTGAIRIPYPPWGFSWMLHAHSGKLIALATGMGEIQLFDLRGKRLGQLLGHKAAIKRGLFSSSDRYMISLDAQNEIRLWNMIDRQQVALLRGDEDIPTYFSFSPDESRVVTASQSGLAYLWETASGNKIRDLPGHSGVISFAKYSPDGSYFVTGSYDGTGKLWDSAGFESATLNGHSAPIIAGDISQSGEIIATGSQDHSVRIWDRNGKFRQVLQGINGNVYEAKFLNDKSLMTYSNDGIVRLFDVSSGKLIVAGPAIANISPTADFSKDGTKIAMPWSEKEVRVVDTRTGDIAASIELDQYINLLKFSADGKLLLGRNNYRMFLWRLSPTEGAKLIAAMTYPFNPTPLLEFASDGRYLAYSLLDGIYLLPVWSEVQTMISDVRKRMPRGLTSEQRKRFFLN